MNSLKLSRTVLTCSESTAWDRKIVARDESDWLGLLLSTRAAVHRGTDVLARIHPT